MDISRQTSQTITAGIICALGLAIFGFLILYQNASTIKDMDGDINKLSAQIEEHRTLLPLFKTLLGEIRKDKPSALSFPEQTKLSRDDMEKAMSLIKTIAASHQLKIKAIEPEIDSVAGTSGHLIMNITMDGNFLNLRGMLIQFGQIPWFETIERLQVNSGDNIKEIKLKISLAIT